jgi:STE24 endopeptidase
MKSVFIIALIVQFFWNLLLTALNVRFIKRNGSRLSEVLPKMLHGHISRDEYQRASDYAEAKAGLGRLESTFALVIVTCVIAFSLLGFIDSAVAGLPMGRVLFILIVMFVGQAAGLPFDIYRVFGIEKRFGFNKTTPRVFVMDLLKSSVLSLIILIPLFGILFWLYDAAGEYWWIWGFAFFSAFQFLMLILYPLIIAPLFNSFTPMPEGELLQGIKTLTEKVNFPLAGVFVVDGSRRSAHSNAYFTGVGKAKRIVLYDTLIESMSQEELLAVLAHELGHFKYHHVKIHLALSVGLSLLGFYGLSIILHALGFFQAMGYETPSIHVGMVLMVIVMPPLEMLLGPLFNMLSRRHEYQADAYAVEAMGEKDSLSQALVQLYKDNLSVPLPHPLYSFVRYSHPPLAERLLGIDKQDSPTSV